MAKGARATPASLESALSAIQKEYGAESLMMMEGDQPVADVEVIPTGSLGLDRAIGVGGWPRGRISEIYGPESSGKTTVALMAAAWVQQHGGTAAFVDAEHALNLDLVRACGVDPRKMHFSQPNSGEEGLGIVDWLVQSRGIDVIIVDSVAALVPKAELEGAIGDAHMALQARLMAQALRKISTNMNAKHPTALIFINQLRERPGVSFGSPEYQPGGKALKFYASLRLDVRVIERLKVPSTGEAYGNKLRVKVVKNKLASPFRQAEFELWFGKGINMYGELLELSIAYGLVKKSGSHYYAGEVHLGQGQQAAVMGLYEHQDVATALHDALVRVLSSGTLPAAVPQEASLMSAPPEFALSPDAG